MNRSPRLECASPGLDVAGPSGKCSDTDWCGKRSLDFPNDQLKKDITSSHPYLRLTGVAVSTGPQSHRSPHQNVTTIRPHTWLPPLYTQVNMELHYSNLNANGKAEMYNDKVRAEVTRSTGLGLGFWG